MDKGFMRHLPGALATALLLSGLVWGQRAAPAIAGQDRPAGPAWWEVCLTVEARGEYTIKSGRAPIAGEYVCRARWKGRLEPDGEDFILVHLETDILEWRLRETAGPAGRGSVLEAPAAAKPAFRMNYVLKDGREVEFFFELGDVSIPLHASPLSVALDLPRSSGRKAGRPGHGYGDFVCRGSSRVAIPGSDLLDRAPERLFSWDWRREKRIDRGGRIYLVAQGHTVEAVVALTAR